MEVVEHLLKQGLSANAKDRLGRTPLHDAMELQRAFNFGLRGDGTREVEIVRTLISHGADVEAVAYEEDDETVGDGERARTITVRRPVTLRQMAERKGLDWSPNEPNDSDDLNVFPLQRANVEQTLVQWRTRNAVKQEFLELLDQATP